MARHWPIFHTVLANMDMVLAKSDLGIARRYAELVPTRALRERIWTLLRTEWERARHWLTHPSRRPVIFWRNARTRGARYAIDCLLDPLNHLQIELLRR